MRAADNGCGRHGLGLLCSAGCSRERITSHLLRIRTTYAVLFRIDELRPTVSHTLHVIVLCCLLVSQLRHRLELPCGTLCDQPSPRLVTVLVQCGIESYDKWRLSCDWRGAARRHLELVMNLSVVSGQQCALCWMWVIWSVSLACPCCSADWLGRVVRRLSQSGGVV